MSANGYIIEDYHYYMNESLAESENEETRSLVWMRVKS
jgi:hypothetical protein